jgi:carbamate kinase
MRIVAALGGNALLRRGEPAEADVQRRNVEVAAVAIAELVAEHEVIVTHGNGPQVGLLALQNDSYGPVASYPLDVLGAESEGMIGYMLEMALRNALPGRMIATLLTEVLVDKADPAFARPSKPIGPVYDAGEAAVARRKQGWTIRPDGVAFRRVVPSPEPQRILAIEAIRTLLETGLIVICAGGGGMPVVAEGGRLRGAEAVIDKDLTAALLARDLEADMLLLLSDVAAVDADWGTAAARPLHKVDPAKLRSLRFAAGTIGPKIEAACRFVEGGGARAAIGALADAARIVEGGAGTQVVESATIPPPKVVSGR